MDKDPLDKEVVMVEDIEAFISHFRRSFPVEDDLGGFRRGIRGVLNDLETLIHSRRSGARVLTFNQILSMAKEDAKANG